MACITKRMAVKAVFLFLLIIYICYGSEFFANYNLTFKENSTAILNFTIVNTSPTKDNKILKVQVSVKNQNASDTLFCFILHTGTTTSSMKSCGYNSQSGEYSVTRQLQGETEFWELTVQFQSGQKMVELVKVQIPEKPEDQENTKTSKAKHNSQLWLTIGAGGFIFFLVVVIATAVCLWKVGKCRSEQRPGEQSGGYYQPGEAMSCHLYFAHAQHSEETAADDGLTTFTDLKEMDTDAGQFDAGHVEEDIYVNQEAWRS